MTEEQKQLVVLAAKAMGFDGEFSSYHEAFITNWDDPTANNFNPLTSDSDCFRMEAELEISIDYNGSYLDAFSRLNMLFRWRELCHADKAAARRLASTRVAAEIQRRKEINDVL